MKLLLLFTLIIISQPLSASVCIPIPAIGTYTGAAFIARVMVKKIYRNRKASGYYPHKIDFVIKELYKGPQLKSVIVSGEIYEGSLVAGEISLTENVELLLYAYKNQDGQYAFNECSSFEIFGKRKKERIGRELAMLEALKKYDSDNAHAKWREVGMLDDLNTFKNIQSDREFALFEIVLDTQSPIGSVRTISGFSEKLDKEISLFLQEYPWKLRNGGESGAALSSKSERITLLVVIFYYPPEKGYPGFLGTFNV